MTQRDKVLQALRDTGSRGIHTFELRAAFIGNPSQRIAELEAAGHTITHTRERLNGDAVGTRYRLVKAFSDGPEKGDKGPDRVTGNGAASEAAIATPVTLFDTQPGFDEICPAPRHAIYDDDQEAA